MRPQFVLTFFVVLALIIGAGWYVKRPGNAVPDQKVEERSTPSAANLVRRRTRANIPLPTPPPTNNITPEQRQASIDREIDRLNALGMKTNPESLYQILADLQHPEKEIRETAIQSVKEFGSSNALPSLKAAVEATEDNDEKIELLEAVKFLSLPRLAFESQPVVLTADQMQVQAQRRLEKDAQHQTRVEKQIRNPNSPPSTNPGSPWEKK